MARSARQSKILEIISTKEIETQEDLVAELRAAKFDVTQATISRDIKELGLIKVVSSDSGKSRYSIMESNEQSVSNKYINILREAVISIKAAQNIVVLKTLRGMSTAISAILDKLNLDNVLGSSCGDETVMVVLPTSPMALEMVENLQDIIGN